jgi:hypothetical protein
VNVLVYATARNAPFRGQARAAPAQLAMAHGERRLLTFNEADFRRFAALIEVVTP